MRCEHGVFGRNFANQNGRRGGHNVPALFYVRISYAVDEDFSIAFCLVAAASRDQKQI
jgi:hypothetical protein